jgi:membrane-associated two-gene conflict system component 1 (EACC1)
VDVSVTVAGSAADQLHSLYTWLVAEEELRGRVRLVEPSPSQGTLGGAPEGLVVALSQGGAGAVLASAIVAWVRHRTSDVVCRVRRPDGAIAEVSGKRVRGADAAMVRELVAEVSRSLEEGFGDGGNTDPQVIPPPQ